MNGKFQNFDTEEKIITAAIADNGNYAVATYSNSYASAVTVFSKRNKQIYEWYSAEDTVNNIALSSTGKKLAVSSFNSSSGLFKSKVNVINYALSLSHGLRPTATVKIEINGKEYQQSAAGDGQYVIDADACVDCGTCAGACPVGAINA